MLGRYFALVSLICLASTVAQAASSFVFRSGAHIDYDAQTATFSVTEASNKVRLYRSSETIQLLASDFSQLNATPEERREATAFIVHSATTASRSTRPVVRVEIQTSQASYEQVRSILSRKRSEESWNNFGLGELEQVMTTLQQNNDNILAGGGRLVGAKKGRGVEGDDFGYTLGMKFAAEAEFERGEVEIELKSDLYGRAVEVGGQKTDSRGRRYAEMLNIDSVEVEVKKDLKNDFFVVFEFGFESYHDQTGFALAVQKAYLHGGKQIHPIEHFDHEVESIGGMMLGRTFTFFKNDVVQVSATFAAGPVIVSSLTYKSEPWKTSDMYDANLVMAIHKAVTVELFSKKNEDAMEKGIVMTVPIYKKANRTLEGQIGVEKYKPLEDAAEYYDRDPIYQLSLRYKVKIGGDESSGEPDADGD